MVNDLSMFTAQCIPLSSALAENNWFRSTEPSKVHYDESEEAPMHTNNFIAAKSIKASQMLPRTVGVDISSFHIL